MQPTEGKRLQLTIDYDVQKAIEDGFDALGFNGAAVVLDPSNGDVLGFTSRPAYDPNAFASGIDRATWASLNTDEDRPLNDRAIQGRYSPGSTFKMAVATRGARGRRHHAGLQGATAPGSATFYGRLQVLEEGRPRHDRPAPCDRAVVQRLLLHRRQHGRHRQDQQVGDAARPRREERHRSAERGAGPRAVARVEAGALQGEVVRRRNDFGRRSARARCR